MKSESFNKQAIYIGTILILLAALIAQYVLLSAYFNNRLAQIQSVESQNYTRLQQVGDFVNQLAAQLPQQQQVQADTITEEATPAE
jgi:hypothetical protein